jgi:hypothetical protein
MERTLQIYVRGNNDLPVVNAACTVWNNYTNNVCVGTTNFGGLVSGVVSYWYESYAGDSIVFNDFVIHAELDGDKAANSSFTVGWTAAGGTDTLTLTGTVGTGEWDGAAQVRKKTGNISIGGAKL